MKICKDCNRENPSGGGIKLSDRSERMIALLVSGGIEDKCDICYVIGMMHSVDFDPLGIEILPANLDGIYPIIHPIMCRVCRGVLSKIPCIRCTQEKRRPEYSLIKERLTVEGSAIRVIQRKVYLKDGRRAF